MPGRYGEVILARMGAKPVSTEHQGPQAQGGGQVVVEETLAGWLLESSQGDAEAFRLFYEATVKKVYGLALSIVRTPPAAEDVVIDVYLRVWRNAGTYDARQGKLLAWLLTICRNCAISAIPRADTVAAGGSYTLLEEKSGHDASDVLAAFEEQSVVRAAMTELHPIEQELLGLAFFRGLSHAEIAESSRLPLGTVKTHIRRAIIKLRQRLSE